MHKTNNSFSQHVWNSSIRLFPRARGHFCPIDGAVGQASHLWHHPLWLNSFPSLLEIFPKAASGSVFSEILYKSGQGLSRHCNPLQWITANHQTWYKHPTHTTTQWPHELCPWYLYLNTNTHTSHHAYTTPNVHFSICWVIKSPSLVDGRISINQRLNDLD